MAPVKQYCVMQRVLNSTKVGTVEVSSQWFYRHNVYISTELKTFETPIFFMLTRAC